MRSTFGHFSPVQIQYGRGCRVQLTSLLLESRCLIVCSKRGRAQLEADRILGATVRHNEKVSWFDGVESNPDLFRLETKAKSLSGIDLDAVIAFGGGSAIDTAKALSLLLSKKTVGQSLSELIIYAPSFHSGTALKLYAVPTTSGTGSEVTPYATLWDHKKFKKLSLSGNCIYPTVAVVDPELTDTVPIADTINTGLDAINQAAESLWNKRMTPLTECWAQRALEIGPVALTALSTDPTNSDLRDKMAQTSLLAGLAISQTRTALCHSISYPLTAHFGIPHGAACAFTMPEVLNYNLPADDGRFTSLQMRLTGKKHKNFEPLIEFFRKLNEDLNVAQSVREAVGDINNMLLLTHEMYTPERADNVLVPISEEALRDILSKSWSS